VSSQAASACQIDIAGDGRFIHRIRFWPAGEFVVLFSDLSIGP
jgi:hypothetical protein